MISALALVPSAFGQAGVPATITPVTGIGQVVRANFPTNEQLGVLVRDSLGNIVVSAPVTFTVLSGVGVVINSTVNSDTNGIASTPFVAGSLFGARSFDQTNVAASLANGVHANFLVTTYGVDFATGVAYVQAYLDFPSLSDLPLRGQVGVLGTTPIQVRVVAIGGDRAGTPITGAGVKIPLPTGVNPGSVQPILSCQGNVTLTDTSGIAKCVTVFSGKPGNGLFTIDASGLASFGPFPFIVTQGPPAVLKIVGGNQQSGNPGALLAAPLVAQVTDVSGNASSGVTVNFESVPAGAVTFTELRNSSDAGGNVSAQARLGSIGGAVRVRVSFIAPGGTTIENFFDLTVNVVIAQFAKASGDNQTLFYNTASQPIVVTATDPQGRPISNLPVTFSLQSGTAVIQTPSATTNAQGQASTVVTSSNVAGQVVIAAVTGGTFRQTFTINVIPPGPQITSNSVSVNPFFIQGGRSNSISPGSVVTISGLGIATGLLGVVAPPNLTLATQIQGVTVMFGNTQALLYNVANVNGVESVTVQVPFDTPLGFVSVKVSVSGGSTTVQVPVTQYAPGLFETTMSDGRRRAVVARPNGSIVSIENPSQRGEVLTLFATGLGGFTPAAGRTTDFAVTAPLLVGVNNNGVQVTSAYYLSVPGIYAVEFVLPNDTPSGRDIPLALAIAEDLGNLQFANGSALVVQ